MLDVSAHLEKLHAAFWGSFDMSRCLHHIERNLRPTQPPARGLEFLGEGAHFAAYKLPGGGTPAMVLKIANTRFRQTLAGKAQQRWIERINSLGSARTVLVPPMQAFAINDTLALCLPFGEIMNKAVDESSIADFYAALKTRDLILADNLQFRWWQNQPFVCDFSDLKHATHGY